MRSESSPRCLFDLSGKLALVTGACGILGSRYIAILAQYGADIVVADRDQTVCEEHSEAIARQYGCRATPIAVDVSNAESVGAMMNQILELAGPLDILVNNAATKGDDLTAFFAATEEYNIDVWREIMAVNLDGVFLVAQAAGRGMARRGKGSIINISSIYGNVGPDQRIYEGSHYLGTAINTPAVYSASKAGVIGLTRYLAALWGSRGVRVNCLTPGGVQSGQNETFTRRYAERVPLGRMAHVDEMNGAIVFLASDASSYITGHNLVVDGGWSIW